MSQTYHSLSNSDSDNVQENKFGSQEKYNFEPSNIVVQHKRPRQKNENGNDSKLEKRKKKEKFQHISPRTCMNYISINIDESIVSNPIFCDIISRLYDVPVTVQVEKVEPDTIFWVRKQISGELTREGHILIVWDHIKMLKHLENASVISFFDDFMNLKRNCRHYLIIYGLKSYCKRLKKKGKLTPLERIINITPSKNMIENILCQLELLKGVSTRLIDNPEELVQFITHSTKSVAEEPYRREKEKIDCEKTSYLQGDSRACVKVDKQNFGMKRLWHQQLTELPFSSLDSAKAVTSVYSTPLALYQTYESMDSILEKERLLQDLIVGREGSKKRLGPEMSKKISQLFARYPDL